MILSNIFISLTISVRGVVDGRRGGGGTRFGGDYGCGVAASGARRAESDTAPAESEFGQGGGRSRARRARPTHSDPAAAIPTLATF